MVTGEKRCAEINGLFGAFNQDPNPAAEVWIGTSDLAEGLTSYGNCSGNLIVSDPEPESRSALNPPHADRLVLTTRRVIHQRRL